MSDDYMKAPCTHCPFRIDVKPFLHPDRALEIAYSTENRYSDFPCHKTTEYDEDSDDMLATQASKTCAGFLAMQIACDEVKRPHGFKMPSNVYSDAYEMIEAYEDEWEARK